MKKLKYFSTFTGIGGLDMGLEELGFECVGFSDIKESSIKVYKSHYPKHQGFGDITKIDFKTIPDFDILTGGFPCQAFSLAGLREGFKDKKGKLIFYLHDLLVTKQPQYFALENVKGILNHDEGKTHDKVVRLLMSAGYHVRPILLNAMHYGSAQSRERVIYLGSKTPFELEKPIIKNDKVVFRDIRDEVGPFKELPRSQREMDKVEQKRDFSHELIGGYDRVGTLTTNQGCGEKCVGYKDYVRYLTPLECERLQGFPDGWTKGISDSDRYFALGNAVNCNMSRYIFKEFLKNIWFK